MAQGRTRSGLGSGGCFASASGWGAPVRGRLGGPGSRGGVAGRGKARMCPNNEIIADQSEQLSCDTCRTCPQKGKGTELVSGTLGYQANRRRVTVG